MYTIEKHLKHLAEEDKEYTILCSIWDLNKKNLESGLSTINGSYPQYSVHDISHSLKIIDGIQNFLGEERIKRLGATDTFLILMACLTHDIGMILTYSVIEKQWSEDRMKEILEEFARYNDKVIANAANVILNHLKEGGKEDNFRWALEIKNAVTILTAEMFRGKHAQLSAENMTTNKEFVELAENFYSKQLPSRFLTLLADVAELHGATPKDVMERLYHKASGLKCDTVHPRFIAFMIRLGDLLDFDSDRFNAYANAAIKQMPEKSVLHRQKHLSVKHILISPTNIEAELDCPSDEVYRIARSWFDWLEDEVSYQSREWSNIVPDDLGGLPPMISRGSIKILYNGVITKPELMNLKFAMSQQKVFDMLKGGGIYDNPGLVFIREIVQNAFDATKIQIWKDIRSGFYDAQLKEVNANGGIKFQDEIPASIIENYPIELSVQWKDDTHEVLHIECSDRGTGISEETLVRMTQQVGESHKNDREYNEIVDSMPVWFKPTAAFGIGLQSVFFVADQFEVETCYTGQTAKRIVFRSSANNQYSSIVTESINHKRGTTVKVDIERKDFAKCFGTSIDISLLDYFNPFEDANSDVNLIKIYDFVRQSFEKECSLAFKFKSVYGELSHRRSYDYCNKENKFLQNEYYKIFVALNSGFLSFVVYDRRIGSQITLFFANDTGRDMLNRHICIRDVSITKDNSFGFIPYMGYFWNLQSPKSDKIVSISRDKLTTEGKAWIRDNLKKVLLPDILPLLKDCFDKYLKCKELELPDIQYFNYCLTVYKFLNNQESIIKMELLKKIQLPLKLFSKNKKQIKAADLFKSDFIYVVNGKKFDNLGYLDADCKTNIEKKYGKVINDGIAVWGDNYLNSFLERNYVCVELIAIEDECSIRRLIKLKSEDVGYHLVKCNSHNDELKQFNIKYLEYSRYSIYGLERYEAIVVRCKQVSGYDRFPAYTDCCIYSPFANKLQIDTLLEKTNGQSDSEIRETVRASLDEYLTPRFLSIVKENNVNENITEGQIRDTYCELLVDFVKAMRTNDNKK